MKLRRMDLKEELNKKSLYEGRYVHLDSMLGPQPKFINIKWERRSQHVRPPLHPSRERWVDRDIPMQEAITKDRRLMMKAKALVQTNGQFMKGSQELRSEGCNTFVKKNKW
ncbi:hypothetical protein RIF29_09967 [Crotalaria pallida]|uniref:Uncharacterized protein n=1 Tax=Crotalaria pallida TaxID=3830 RepID=A0AAN9FSE7_CROPI